MFVKKGKKSEDPWEIRCNRKISKLNLKTYILEIWQVSVAKFLLLPPLVNVQSFPTVDLRPYLFSL